MVSSQWLSRRLKQVGMMTASGIASSMMFFTGSAGVQSGAIEKKRIQMLRDLQTGSVLEFARREQLSFLDRNNHSVVKLVYNNALPDSLKKKGLLLSFSMRKMMSRCRCLSWRI